MPITTLFETLQSSWPHTSPAPIALSLVFTDAPYELSEIVVEAIIVDDGDGFRRILRAELCQTAEVLLANFQYDAQIHLLCPIGDAVAWMAEARGHQMLTGQAYLTTQSLAVSSIHGRNNSDESDAGPSTVRAVVRPLAKDYASQDAEFLDWATSDADQRAVSVEDLEITFADFGMPKIEWDSGDWTRMMNLLPPKEKVRTISLSGGCIYKEASLRARGDVFA